MYFHKISKSILDIVYPPACLACGISLLSVPAYNDCLCKKCFDSIRFIRNDYCIKCGKGFGAYTGVLKKCGNCCAGGLHFNRCIGAAHYEGPVRELVHKLKFNGEKAAAKLLSEFIARKIEDQDVLRYVDLIVPVAIHKNKLKKRRYNQAELIGYYLEKHLKLPMVTGNLRRLKETTAQFALSRHARFKNLRGAFVVKNPSVFAGKGVLLVDDVLTTGATSAEISRMLKKAGAHRIFVAVVGR
ncbi:MAG: ComF family protein [Planctomycetes bacterium]|nr:ComF family protein [Planctomycetota bacterium]